MNIQLRFVIGLLSACFLMASCGARAQTGPTRAEQAAYSGLHAAASNGDVVEIRRMVAVGADLENRDRAGRTPLHVAAFNSHDQAMEALAKAGADLNALEGQAYDVVTIAAVANDLEILKLALFLGAKPGNITSPYDGTALIAAAHLGHVEIVRTLIKAGAPLDHINNLGWTALIEAVVLGDGGIRHINVARALINAGANINISDRQGVTPLTHAEQRGFVAMITLFRKSSD